jgi:hypothetical protein
LVAACSSPHHTQPSDATGGDAGVVGHLSFETQCATTSAVTFDTTPPGETAMAIVFAVNDSDSDVTLERDLTQFSGPDAADFAMTGYGDWCYDAVYSTWVSQFICCPLHALPPHAWCELPLEFRPTSLGLKQGVYTIGGGAGTLTLSGEAVVAPATFHADRVNVATSYITAIRVVQGTYSPPTVSFKLINDSTQTVDVGTLAIDPMYAASDDCPASLTPGGACNARVSLILDAFHDPPQIPGCRTTNLTSSTSALSVPITYAPPPAPVPTAFSVWLIGDGGGEVTSSPSGINCAVGDQGPGCYEQLWSPPATLELTETPAAGSEFVGWFSFRDSGLLPCGTDPTCTRTLPAPSLFQPTGDQVEAWFAPATDKHVHVTIVGTGDVVAASLAHSTTSWTFDVTAGSSTELSATTTGTFVGWSGDCTGTGACQLGAVINDRNVTATFNP